MQPETPSFEVLGWEEFTPALLAEWRGLLEAGDLHLSLGPDWVRVVAMAHGRLGDVRLFVGRRNGTLFGVIPFFAQRARMFRIPVMALGLAGNVVSYHHELVAPGHEAELLDAWLDSRPWDVFIASGLRKGGPSARAALEVADRRGSYLLRLPGEQSPYLPITSTWERFLAAKSRNFRSNLNRKEKRLAAAGTLEERWFRSADDVDELFRCMLTVEANSWKAVAGIAITGRPHEQEYYRLLLPVLAERGQLAANALYLDGSPVAYHLCYSSQGRVGNLKTSFQDRFQELSPGAVVIARAIRKVFEEGAQEFDFHGGPQAHKSLWTEEVREHETLYLFSRRMKARSVGILKAVANRIQLRSWRGRLSRNPTTAALTAAGWPATGGGDESREVGRWN
jgi:CelD/BcsL family acetyltransferase involved in cellulose biosynthesis